MSLPIVTLFDIQISGSQFLQIAVKVCPKLSEETALIITEETWEQQEDISRETSEM